MILVIINKQACGAGGGREVCVCVWKTGIEREIAKLSLKFQGNNYNISIKSSWRN